MPHRLFFAHANGFPSETYRKLFALLEPDFHVHRLERHGHDPRYPVDANWNSLVAELIESLERLDGPVMVRGRDSRTVLPHQVRMVRRLPRGECLSVPGGHMFPLERPAHTAELVRNLLSRWEEQTP